MSEPKPTIENPFAADTKQPRTKSTPRSAAKPKPVATIRKKPELPEEEEYNPGFYVSEPSKDLVKSLLESGDLTKQELPFIWELAVKIAPLFGRKHPTVSDVEAAARFRTLEFIREVASGEKQLDIERKKTTIPTPKQERLKIWNRVAVLLVEGFDQ
jgi:hypothetical protein